ncbi:PREDICTED: uncharacterized protein LOC104727813 [Camelina sativa]|uniref:Uncharacterized protein LOC104727813 n=1 Tax=Camelina sativa TaxID=90675 RepID=A0ABM0URU4_CAMSA|nr:PREDICTED: uncharacterized protein LOC104727813 [Camelina sativa]
MQHEETVEFKMDVSDENIRRKAMRVVWMVSGVTYVDIKEKGILKVKGIFDKMELGRKLQEIDDSVDIINPMGNPGQSRIPGLSTVYSYLTTPKVQEILVFKFKVLNESIIPYVMDVIWEFSGVTSVEIKGDDELEVNGEEFSKIAMAKKLKDIDESVSVIIKADPGVQAAPNNGTSYATKITNALSSFRMPSAPVRVPPPAPVRPPPAPVYARGHRKSYDDGINKPNQQPILNAVAARVRDFMNKPNANKFNHNAEIIGRKKPQPQVKHQEQEGGMFGFFGKKQQPGQKDKCAREIPKPQVVNKEPSASTSKSGTSKKEGETQYTWDPSSLVTGLTTMNPFQTENTNSQMTSSQTNGSTQNQHSTQKKYQYRTE